MYILKWQILALSVLHCLRDTLSSVNLLHIPELVPVHVGDNYTYGYYCDDSSHDVQLYILRTDGECDQVDGTPPRGHCTVNLTLTIEANMSGLILMYRKPNSDSCDLANAYGRRPVMLSVANCTDQERLPSPTSSLPAVSPTRVSPQLSSSPMATSPSSIHLQSSEDTLSSSNSLHPSPSVILNPQRGSVDSETFTAITAVLVGIILISWVLGLAIIFYLRRRRYSPNMGDNAERTRHGLVNGTQNQSSSTSVQSSSTEGSVESNSSNRAQMEANP